MLELGCERFGFILVLVEEQGLKMIWGFELICGRWRNRVVMAVGLCFCVFIVMRKKKGEEDGVV